MQALEIAGGCAIICCWTVRRSAVRARMLEAFSTVPQCRNCRHDPLGQASRLDLMRLLRLSPVRMQGLIVMLQLGTPAAASAAYRLVTVTPPHHQTVPPLSSARSH